MTEAKSFRAVIRAYSSFKIERLSVYTKLTLQKGYNRVGKDSGLPLQAVTTTYWICTAYTTRLSTPPAHQLPRAHQLAFSAASCKTPYLYDFYRCKPNYYGVVIVKMFGAEDEAKPNTVIPRIRGLNTAVRLATVQVTRLLTGHKPVNTGVLISP